MNYTSFHVVKTPVAKISVNHRAPKTIITIGGKATGVITIKVRPAISGAGYKPSAEDELPVHAFTDLGNELETYPDAHYEPVPGEAGAGVITLSTLGGKRTVTINDFLISSIMVSDNTAADGNGQVPVFWVNVEHFG